MLKQTDIPPHERAIVEAFKADLPEIDAGCDPFIVPRQHGYKHAPTLEGKTECSVDGCTDAACLKGMCQPHYNAQFAKRRKAKASL